MKVVNEMFDLVVVGAGIVGLATAYAARQRGLRVAVLERNARCIGASIRNFGFVTVTGQRRGEHWTRARRSRDVWARIAPQAGIQVIHTGLNVLAQRPEGVPILQAFLDTEMGEGCRFLDPVQARQQVPELQAGYGVLHSPHELRVESRDAIPLLANWLAQSQGVEFFWNTAVHAVDLPVVHTSRGDFSARYCVVCPGYDVSTLFPDLLAETKAQLCTLQMLRVQPAQPVRLSGAVMSDLSLVRYDGYADLSQAAALKARLREEQPVYLQHGIHLIAVQSADGSLVVGDSHVYGEAEAPFASQAIDDLILDELHRVLNVPGARVVERWTGTYPSAAEVVFKASAAPGVVVGMVTGGTGASTGFAFGEELVALALGD